MQQELIDMLEETISYVEVWHKEDQDVIDRAEALVEKAKNSNAPAVPQGWKLVPVEPTRAMWAAVNKLDDEMAAGSYDGKGCSIEQAWNCMLDFAPDAPALEATPAPAPAQYKDSTPQLSVGESSFESWFESYNPANKGDKQRARDAYAAGMGDPLVTVTPAQEPVTLTDDELIDAWNSVEPGPDSTENVIVLRMRAIIAALRAKEKK